MSRRLTLKAALAALAVATIVAATPLSASAVTRHTYWDGVLAAYVAKLSATKPMIGAHTGGSIGINVTVWAQTVTPYGVYASAETTMGSAQVQHSSVTVQARCFQRPFAGAAPATPHVVCNYLT